MNAFQNTSTTVLQTIKTSYFQLISSWLLSFSINTSLCLLTDELWDKL